MMSKLKIKTYIQNLENRIKKFYHYQSINVDFYLPQFSATEIVACKCHLDNSIEIMCIMIMDRYIITPLGIVIELYKHSIMVVMVPCKGCTEKMVDLIYCESKLLNKNTKIKQNESFMEAHVDE